ncbi:HAMP domain-containing protein [Lampropedia aestuarii]|uniref:HAMP domain-containing protein n=1 Tax=Lampropedia aestuarii TaxID=2562762 RepID=A0A4S5BV73_9BURK|nr:methyl-accepting chemotaxis protein [Lampropedia aestuarii]MDH5856821.1 methyl-accepting chemotaxis protein [Lampropedia aestuarii]THJ36409.1 HAMP domain-containing protein [Lampropedia aestuarii]
MWFANISIRSKLLWAFFILVALAGVLGFVSLRQLMHVHLTSEEVNLRWLPAISESGQLSTALNRVRRIESRLSTVRNMAELQQFQSIIDQRLEQLKEHEARFEKSASDAQSSALLLDYNRSLSAYNTARVELLGLAQQALEYLVEHQVRNQELFQGIRDYYSGPLEQSFAEVENQISRLQKWSNDKADEANLVVASTYRAAIVQISIVLILTIAAALVLTILITRLITEPVRRAVNAMQAVSQGNLTAPISITGKDEMGQMLMALESMRQKLQSVVSGVRSNAEGVAAASSQIAQGNNDLSIRTEQQASSLEEIAASMEELGSTVHQNADHAHMANQVVINTTKTAIDGGEVMQQAVQTMQTILDGGREIEEIIAVIDNIAFQTNILALNAAVEAARAGEQGRGFAVVANEVRSLAQRSAESSKEVKALVAGNAARVNRGADLMGQAGKAMEEIVQSIRHVTDLVGEISAASTEQSAGVSQVGEAIVQMDQVTQRNAALVEESAAAAVSLSHQAQELLSSVEVFKLAHTETAAMHQRKPMAEHLAGGSKEPGRSGLQHTSYAHTATAHPAPPAPKAANHQSSTPRNTKDDANWESF